MDLGDIFGMDDDEVDAMHTAFEAQARMERQRPAWNHLNDEDEVVIEDRENGVLAIRLTAAAAYSAISGEPLDDLVRLYFEAAKHSINGDLVSMATTVESIFEEHMRRHPQDMTAVSTSRIKMTTVQIVNLLKELFRDGAAQIEEIAEREPLEIGGAG